MCKQPLSPAGQGQGLDQGPLHAQLGHGDRLRERGCRGGVAGGGRIRVSGLAGRGAGRGRLRRARRSRGLRRGVTEGQGRRPVEPGGRRVVRTLSAVADGEEDCLQLAGGGHENVPTVCFSATSTVVDVMSEEPAVV